jgi:hypothetical protein
MLVGTIQGKEQLGIPKRKILKQLVIKGTDNCAQD